MKKKMSKGMVIWRLFYINYFEANSFKSQRADIFLRFHFFFLNYKISVNLCLQVISCVYT